MSRNPGAVPGSGAAEEIPEVGAGMSTRAMVEEVISDIRAGRPVVVVGGEEGEDEGNLTIAAQFVTPAVVNFMAAEARGLICVPMTADRADLLELPAMAQSGTSPLAAAFTVSVEAAEGVTSGMSAQDRALTIRVLADPEIGPRELTRPGHVFPLRARDGGVLARAGRTEASVDLCRLAGVEPVAATCEILREDGLLARTSDLEVFAARHDLKIVSVTNLIQYRLRRERLIERAEETSMPTTLGEFRAIGFRTQVDTKEYVALVLGTIQPEQPTLVYIHEQCIAGDVFGSMLCDCAQHLKAAMQRIADEGYGVVIYVNQEGRGVQLHDKPAPHGLQWGSGDFEVGDGGSSSPLSVRAEYIIRFQILADLGVGQLQFVGEDEAPVRDLWGEGRSWNAGQHDLSQPVGARKDSIGDHDA